MILSNKEIGLTLFIKDDLIAELKAIGVFRYPNEFGGLLIGYYSEDRKKAIIERTLLPKKYKSSKYSFERGSDGLKKKLEKLYSQTPSLFYIGEWHTHPDGPPVPSITDCCAMDEIAHHEDVLIENPVLLIISVKKGECYLAFYVYFNNKIYRYDPINFAEADKPK